MSTSYLPRVRAEGLRAFFAALTVAAVVFAAGAAQAQAPVNDTCTGAELIPPVGPFPYLTAVSDIASATPTAADAGVEPIPSCATTSTRGVWYSFTPAFTGTYVFSTCNADAPGTTVVDTSIAVFTAAADPCIAPMTQLPPATGGCDDNSCRNGSSQAITGNLLNAGTTYYVLVSKVGSTAPAAGATSVQLRVSMTPNADTCGTAIPLTLGLPVESSNYGLNDDYQVASACFTGIGQTTSSTLPGRDAVYSFTAPATGRYSFRAMPYVTDTDNLGVYVSSSCPTGSGVQTLGTGVCLAAANRTSSTSSEDVTCLPLDANQTVYAYVDDSTLVSGGVYNFAVTPCSPETEPNNTPATANALACGITGTIGVGGDYDYYDVGIAASGYRIFSLVDANASSTTDLDMRINTATTTLEYDDGDGDPGALQATYSPLIAGTPLTGVPTYVGVNAYSSSNTAEPYRLYAIVRPPLAQATAEVEPNNTMATATPATYASGTLTTPAPSTDQDWYSFTAAAGDVVFVGLDGNPTRDSTTVDARITLFDSTGRLLVTANDSNTSYSSGAGTSLTSTSPASPGEGLVYRVTASGTYFVRVNIGTTSTSSYGAGDYLLSIALNCENGSTAPSVSAVAPSAGSTVGGTAITISGSNFVAPAAVKVGSGVATSVVVVNANTITAVTPAGTAGLKDVTVFNPDAKRGVLTGAFTYVPPPSITSLTPNSGPTAGGTTVDVNGTAFQPGATVTVGGAAATVSAVTATKITIVTPPGTDGAAPVVVTNADGQVSAPVNFTYLAPPAIASISPASGKTAGGDSVTLTGTFFRAGATVTIGGAAATSVVVTNATTLTAVTPPGTAGAADVTVANPDGQSFTLPGAFTFVPPPHISSLNPVSGFTPGGDTITVNGTDFLNGATVTFDGIAATSVTFVSATQLTAVNPGHAPGAVTVAVTNPDGQVDSVPNAFTYVPSGPPPVISTVTPSTGTTAGGDTLTLTGTDFDVAATVTIGGAAPASFTVDSATQITLVTPAHAFGTVAIRVTNPDNQFGEAQFTYVHPDPVLNSVTPSSGPTAGGTSVTLAGNNFLPGATATIGGAPLNNLVVVNATTVTATTPAQAGGTKDIVLTNADGKTVTLANAFTYLPPPAISALSVNHGTTLGGESVTITGADFLTGATVNFGTTPATNVVVVNATTITLTTPARAPGTVSVTVVNGDGQTATLANAFTFIRPPQLMWVSPTSVPTAGGAQITLNGVDFASGATVSFGATPAAAVAFVSGIKLTATTPAMSEGTVSITVTNPDGQLTTLANAITFYAAPVITQVAPATGPSAGGNQVVITGDKFRAGATAFFGGVQAFGGTVTATQLTVQAPAGTGTVDVTVRNVDGQQATLPQAYTYAAAPQLTEVTPSSGPEAGGTVVTLKGDHFDPAATVTFGPSEAQSVTFTDEQTLTATAPQGTGTVDVTVANPDGQKATLAQAFRFVAPPAIDAITPSTGPSTGGTKITLTGSQFAPAAKVTIGGVAPTSLVYESAQQLSAWTPAHAVGAVDVVVTNPDGQSATVSGGFTYEAVNPTLTAITPTSGSAAGGTPVLLTGTGFGTGAKVTFDTTEATDTRVLSANTISVRAPAHAEGVVDVTVTNEDGRSATLADAFTYTPAPDAGVETPDAGTPDAGTADAGVDAGTGVDIKGSGCGCSETDASSFGFGFLALGLLLWRRRAQA